MKKMLFHSLAAAALAVGSQAGAAASQVLEMSAPVAFKTTGAAMPEGRYIIELTRMGGGSPLVKISSRDGKHAAMSLASQSEVRQGAGSATVRFACLPDADCRVQKITVGSTVWSLPAPKLTPEQQRKLYTLSAPLEPVRAAE